MATHPQIFIMAGMPRAGTTYMYQALQLNPGIYLPYRKELSFFSINHERGLNWYLHHFRNATKGQICGDISPDYFLHPHTLQNLESSGIRSKMILCVRDPVSWALSFHRHLATFEARVPPFEMFLDSHAVPDNRFFKLNREGSRVRFSISASLIEHTVEKYRQFFGDDLLLYSFDTFRAEPGSVVRAIETFLEVKQNIPAHELPNGAINSSKRRNIRLLSYVISREEFITAANAVLPDRVLQRLRSRFDKLSVSHKENGAANRNWKQDEQLGEERLTSDRQYVRTLFSSAQIQLGSGKSFGG